MHIILQAAAGAAIAFAAVTAAVTSAKPEERDGPTKEYREPMVWAIQMDDLKSKDGVPFMLTKFHALITFDSKDECNKYRNLAAVQTILARVRAAVGEENLGSAECKQVSLGTRT